MRRSVLLVGALFLLLALPLAAGHGGTSHGEITQRTVSAHGEVVPGDSERYFVELDLEAEEGAVWTYTMSATSPVHFNIHEHDFGTNYLVRHEDTTSVEESFTVPHNGTFSIMVGAPSEGSVSDVEITLEGRYAIVGSVGLTIDGASEDSPVAPWPLVVMAVLLLAATRRR